MKQTALTLCRELLERLHACPEVSGQEVRTRQLLQSFLREHTTLELHSCGEGFYAVRRGTDQQPAIAFRADYDALPLPEGGAAHLCGHDGHAAALCGVALELSELAPDRTVILLFQPAEETGAGAKGCCELFELERVGEIYGAHNLPGLPFGQVVTRTGTFACASCGITLYLTGAAAHAAYPEEGVSPANAVGRLLCALPELSGPGLYPGMTMCTMIGTRMGEKAFGSAAADAEVWLTLRAERTDDLASVKRAVLDRAARLAEEEKLAFRWEEQDAFPATENHTDCAEKVLRLCGGALLEAPMRWSEDFGHYLRRCPGAFFGIGAGENCPALHTSGYRYPEALLEPTVEAFCRLLFFAWGAARS